MALTQITDFSGGVNNSIDPRLIPLNFAQTLKNANVESRVLSPEVGKKEVSDPDLPELTNQNGDRSIVRFGDHYYYSDNSTGVIGSTLGYVGITPPEIPVLVRQGAPGDRLEGKYKYIGIYATKEGHRSPAYLPGREQFFQAEIDASLQVDVALQLSGLQDWGDFAAIVANAGRDFQAVSVGSRFNYLGKSWQLKSQIFLTPENNNVITGPPFSPNDANNLWEDITGQTISVSGLKSIIISRFGTPTQRDVDRILLFRTLANGETYYFVASVDLEENSSYEDSFSDAQIAFNEQLEIVNAFPPIYVRNTRVGGKYLTEVNERYWLAVDNRLHHSLQSNPHAWVPSHSVEFDSDITALAKAGDSILVFTGEGNPYIVSGNREDNTIAKVQIPTTQGCPNWKTIAYVGNSPVWQSAEGVCVLSQRPLGQDPQVQVLSKDKYDFPRIADFALANKGKYCLFFNEEKEKVVFDLERDRFYTRTITADYGYTSNLTARMYLVEDAIVYDADEGDFLEFEYKSPKLHGNLPNTLKMFKTLDVESDEEVLLSTWHDNRKTLENRKISGDRFKIVQLPAMDAYMLEVGLKSKGKIYNVTVSHELRGR